MVILNEQHDVNAIAIDLKELESRIVGRAGVWDAVEMGITREEAAARIRAADTPEARSIVMLELRTAAKRRANLATIMGKVAYAGVGLDQWHGLGVSVSEFENWQDCMQHASLGYSVRKFPVRAVIGEGEAATTVSVSNVYAVGRVDEEGAKPVMFDGVAVSKDYSVVQNSDCFRFLDEVMSPYGAVYDSAGALGNGERIWISLRMPQVMEPVLGDAVRNYVVLTASHNGSASIWVYSTNVRIVCANTYRQSRVDRRNGLRIAHGGKITHQVRQVKEALGFAQQSFVRSVEFADQLVRQKQQPEPFIDAVLDAVQAVGAIRTDELQMGFDAAANRLSLEGEARELFQKNWLHRSKRREAARTTMLDIYESETNTAPGTLWAAVQAVTQYSSHHLKYRGSQVRQRETRLMSMLSGRASALNQVAFEHALTLCV